MGHNLIYAHIQYHNQLQILPTFPPCDALLYIICCWFAIDKITRNGSILQHRSADISVQIDQSVWMF